MFDVCLKMCLTC